ncbi:DUF262 domain-containing protein [Campylobacter majalis]|uniref:DUF262 domain-containing protein n=1 Tax=Campylobacter majalis TaxID=2790656 RepID=UPI003D69C469
MANLSVGTASIGEILELENSNSNEILKGKTLSIPNYQRPYTWSTQNVNELIDDILEAIELDKEQYLIGNIILHENDGKLDIIDGQQRLTTLALILHSKNDNNTNTIKFLENEVDINSAKALTTNYNLISQHKKIDDNFRNFIKANVIVTYTITTNLDQAFILFNSQNTRGKPLDDKDLLKGHHIRFIKRKSDQKEYAKSFEIALREKRLYKDKLTIVLKLLSIIKSAAKNELDGDSIRKTEIYENFKSEFEADEIGFNNYHDTFIATTSVQGGAGFFSILAKI